ELAAWREQLGLYMWLTGTWASTGYTLMTACWLLALRGLPLMASALPLLAFLGASIANHLAWSVSGGAENVQAFQLASGLDAVAFEARLPSGTRLQRFGDRAVLTALTYRHGHFGPALLGPLRRCLPSPIQCNVRVYLESPACHVMFVSTCIDSAPYFLGSRLL